MTGTAPGEFTAVTAHCSCRTESSKAIVKTRGNRINHTSGLTPHPEQTHQRQAQSQPAQQSQPTAKNHEQNHWKASCRQLGARTCLLGLYRPNPGIRQKLRRLPRLSRTFPALFLFFSSLLPLLLPNIIVFLSIPSLSSSPLFLRFILLFLFCFIIPSLA